MPTNESCESFKLDDKCISRIGWWTEPDFHTISVGEEGITAIDCREQFLGEYSIVWFQIWKDERLVARYNARNVDTVEYEDEYE